jgi:hypothetical protein
MKPFRAAGLATKLLPMFVEKQAQQAGKGVAGAAVFPKVLVADTGGNSFVQW